MQRTERLILAQLHRIKLAMKRSSEERLSHRNIGEYTFILPYENHLLAFSPADDLLLKNLSPDS